MVKSLQEMMHMQHSNALDTWLRKAAVLLESNRISFDGHSYTAPSLDTVDFGRKDYANQYLWDSCFHAVIWRRIDPQQAQAELLSLVSRQVEQGTEAGMIPHCNYWRNEGAWLWSQPERSSITHPPLIAVAAGPVFEQSHDREFLASIYPKVERYHDWFDRRRDPDQDGLVCIIHPWEAGGDAPPRWDTFLGLDKYVPEAGRAARIKMVEELIRYEYDPIALAEHGCFHVESLEINAIRAADMEAMSKIAQALGKPAESVRWLGRAEAVRQGFRSKMTVDGLPYDLEGLDEKPILPGQCRSVCDPVRRLAHARSSREVGMSASRVTLLDSVSHHQYANRFARIFAWALLAWKCLALPQLADLSGIAPLWL
jgi:hypothetical protein